MDWHDTLLLNYQCGSAIVENQGLSRQKNNISNKNLVLDNAKETNKEKVLFASIGGNLGCRCGDHQMQASLFYVQYSIT